MTSNDVEVVRQSAEGFAGKELTTRSVRRAAARKAMDDHKIPQRGACSLRDELLNEEIFGTLDDARRKLALWRYDYNNVRPHASLGNQAPVEARRALEQFEGSAHDALTQTDDEEYEIQTRELSL